MKTINLCISRMLNCNGSLSRDIKAIFSDSPFFAAGWALWLSGHIFQQSAIYMDSSTPFLKGVYLLSFALTLLQGAISVKKNKWKFLPCLFVLPFLYFFTGTASIFIQGLYFVILGRDVPFKRIAKITFVITAVCCAIIVTLSICGLIENFYHVDHRGRARWAMGFTYYSRLSNFVLTLTLLAIYIWGDNLNVTSVLFLGAATFFSFFTTDSRNPFLFTLLALVLFFLVRILNCSFKSIIYRRMITPIFFICAALITILSMIYDPSIGWLDYLNDLTSNRLIYSNRGIDTCGLNLLGSDAIDDSNVIYAKGYFDSSYLVLIFKYGLLVAAITLFGWTKLLWDAIKSRQRYLVVCLVVIALHSILEWELTWLIYTPFMFLLFRRNPE